MNLDTSLPDGTSIKISISPAPGTTCTITRSADQINSSVSIDVSSHSTLTRRLPYFPRHSIHSGTMPAVRYAWCCGVFYSADRTSEYTDPPFWCRCRPGQREKLPLLRESQERHLLPTITPEGHRERLGSSVREADAWNRWTAFLRGVLGVQAGRCHFLGRSGESAHTCTGREMYNLESNVWNHRTRIDPRVLRRRRPQSEGALQGRGGQLVCRGLRQGRELEARGELFHLSQRPADQQRPRLEGLRRPRRQCQRQRDAPDILFLHPPGQGSDWDLGSP